MCNQISLSLNLIIFQVLFQPKLVPKPVIQIYTVNAEIKYRYATTTIFSGVFNSADVAQEVSFIVTIPDSAFISEFLLYVSLYAIYAIYATKKQLQHVLSNLLYRPKLS